MSYKLLIIEEDDVLRSLLRDELASLPEFTTFAEKDRKKGEALALAKQFDALIFEVGTKPGMGKETVEALRAGGFKAPIIVLSDGEADSEAFLGTTGANDYVVKPFRIATLLARIKAQLRQYEQLEDTSLDIGPYILKPGQKILLDQSGDKIRLTEKETDILKYLFRADGQAVERNRLLEEVWGYNSGVTTHTLETHIYRLRQKIETDPAEAQILRTTPGGYRLGS